MSKKQSKFVDDGWAVWVDGDDTSTVYINNWLNPKGKNYVDIAVRIRGVKVSKYLNVYVPFAISSDEIEDVSLLFNDTKILQATFSTACIVDYKKNEHTSEIAYNGKTVDIVHISTLKHKLDSLADGTLIGIDLDSIQQFIDNDEAYFIWRMPQKSLDELFKVRVDMGNTMSRLRDLITTPVISSAIIKRFLLNFVGNIALFIPWGFLLPIHIEKTRKFIKFALMSLATIVLIEAVQIFSMLGSFDIEDILLNMLGASIGFYCWNVLLGKK